MALSSCDPGFVLAQSNWMVNAADYDFKISHKGVANGSMEENIYIKSVVHSDQRSQYGSTDYRDFLTAHNLTPSMNRRGHCLDNAVTESFFLSLKTEGVKRKIYATRSDTRGDLFNYIEMPYNRTRLHSHLGHVSPDEHEMTYSRASLTSANLAGGLLI